MAKKTFARARVVKGARWTIDYTVFDAQNGVETRHRRDFDLNEIDDLTIRAAVAERIARYIEVFSGAAAPKPSSPTPTLKEAVEAAHAAKMNLPRANSHKQYQVTTRHFLKWAKAQGAHKWRVEQFTRRHALEYWDALRDGKKLRARTLVDYLAALRAMWSEMIEREMVEENPWTRIKPPRKEEKLRRPFTDPEKRTVAAWCEQNDYWMFRAILLQYFCFIRPVELTRLRFKDFDLGRGLVTVRETEAKTYKKAIKTVPKSVLHYFIDGKFDKYPANFFVFGRVGDARRGHMAPATVAIHENRMYKKHAKILARLKAAGALGDTAGLTWYSWKDTGISTHIGHTSPLATKDQAGHSNLVMTEVYYHRPDINMAYLSLENDITGV